MDKYIFFANPASVLNLNGELARNALLQEKAVEKVTPRMKKLSWQTVWLIGTSSSGKRKSMGQLHRIQHHYPEYGSCQAPCTLKVKLSLKK